MIKNIKWPILSAFLVLSISVQAQLIEFGGGVGVLNYAGDLSRGAFSSEKNFAFQGHYRINISKIVSTKFSMTLGTVSGSDSRPIDPASALRDASFSRSILEGAASMEYHFLDYKNDKSAVRFSPYAFVGAGFVKMFGVDQSVEGFGGLQPVMPFGIGIKQLVGKRFSIDLELGARKLFFDQFDGVSDGDIFDKNYQYGNPKDKDWYHFAGISISYIIHNIPCLYQYIPNKSIYD